MVPDDTSAPPDRFDDLRSERAFSLEQVEPLLCKLPAHPVGRGGQITGNERDSELVAFNRGSRVLDRYRVIDGKATGHVRRRASRPPQAHKRPRKS